ncbi:MAG: phenylacetate--CoA ligase family protein [Desulfobacteraceae bacterium]|nr:MAG: phenylacetate--CoA ligase family protein [Desulfobacteraceae bacterium]
MINNKYLHLIQLMRNERCPLEELRSIQNKKLKRLVRHAYHHIPFYRNQFRKINLHPDDIRTVDDLYKIPIIDKADFYKYPFSYFLDDRIKSFEKLIRINTSGSSGQILQFFVDQRYNQLRKAQFLRPYMTNGCGLMDRTVWFRGRPEAKQMLHQKLGLLKDHQFYSGLDPDFQIQLVQKIRPKVMRGYGSTFQLMASRILEKGIAVHSPRLIFTDSEMLNDNSRRKIETAFQAEVIDVYGTFETENIAYECRKHNGYHMAVDCVIMEFLKDGIPVKPGEEGEIICTVLDNFTFPFIRYNLHDLGSWLDRPCTCGRTFPLMKTISGRTSHYFKKRDGSKISSISITSHMWHLGQYIHEFQIIQKATDLFLLLIVPSCFFSEKIQKEIEKLMYKDFPYATIRIRLVDHIEREKSGKLLDFKPFLEKQNNK